MDIIEVTPADSAEELLDLLALRNQLWQPHPDEWVFRGQADSRWQLQPTAFRDSTRFEYGAAEPYAPRPTHAAQVKLEATLIRLFVLGMDEQGHEFPSESAFKVTDWRFVAQEVDEATSQAGVWPPEELQPLFALAQHHGVPTRLLDWTHKPLTAAYFAAERAAHRFASGVQRDGRFSIWAYRHSADALWDDAQFYPVIVRVPRSRNPNLHAQGGVFIMIVNRAAEENGPAALPAFDQLVRERARNTPAAAHDAWPILRRFDVPVTESGALLRLLHQEGISALHLFPGLDGVVKGIQERSLWGIAGERGSGGAGDGGAGSGGAGRAGANGGRRAGEV